MSPRALLVAVPVAAAFMALAPAAADESAKLLTAAQAAICGPELKDLSVNDHEFNVKEATVGINPWDHTTVTVAGQISHRLGMNFDDQVYYTINYVNGVPNPADIRIEHGGVAAILGIVLDAVTLGVEKIEILGIGLELNVEKLPEIATEFSKLIHGSGWEDQAAAIIAFIGVAATQPADDVCAMDIPGSGGGGTSPPCDDCPPTHEN